MAEQPQICPGTGAPAPAATRPQTPTGSRTPSPARGSPPEGRTPSPQPAPARPDWAPQGSGLTAPPHGAPPHTGPRERPSAQRPPGQRRAGRRVPTWSAKSSAVLMMSFWPMAAGRGRSCQLLRAWGPGSLAQAAAGRAGGRERRAARCCCHVGQALKAPRGRQRRRGRGGAVASEGRVGPAHRRCVLKGAAAPTGETPLRGRGERGQGSIVFPVCLCLSANNGDFLV